MAENVVGEFRANRRAKAVLNRMVATRQISNSGLKWLEIATDPFHDTEIISDGYPDMVTTRSIVQTVTATYEVIAPADATWDCHIFFNPCSPIFRQGTTLTTTTQTTGNRSDEKTQRVEEKKPEKPEYKKVKVSEIDPKSTKWGSIPEKYRKALPWTLKLQCMLNDEWFSKNHPEEIERISQKIARSNEEESSSESEYEWDVDKFIDGMVEQSRREEFLVQKERLRYIKDNIRKQKQHPESIGYNGYYRTTITAAGQIAQAGSGNILGPGWNCMSIGAGSDWQLTSASSFTSGWFPANYGAGTYRLIATGLEVVNTTAALYKGGAVTVYRSPCPKSNMTARIYNADADVKNTSLGSFPVGVLPPSTQAKASLYPNSKTWGAEQGIYLVGTLNSTDNPYYTPMPGISGLLSPTSYTSMEAGDGWVGYLPRILAPPTTAANFDLSACSTVWPWDISGAIFSGLNPNSTLQVTVRYYIERHPSIAEPDLLVLARTPCPYDPVVQEIYARAMHELPVGVPVGMNPLGEWFNEVLEAVASWAPEIGKAVGNIIPGAALVGNAAGLGAQKWLATRKNTKGGGSQAPQASNGGKKTKKVKFDKKGNVKEIDTTVVKKKKKYTKAQKRAYKARKILNQAGKMKSAIKGPKRRPPAAGGSVLRALRRG